MIRILYVLLFSVLCTTTLHGQCYYRFYGVESPNVQSVLNGDNLIGYISGQMELMHGTAGTGSVRFIAFDGVTTTDERDFSIILTGQFPAVPPFDWNERIFSGGWDTGETLQLRLKDFDGDAYLGFDGDQYGDGGGWDSWTFEWDGGTTLNFTSIDFLGGDCALTAPAAVNATMLHTWTGDANLDGYFDSSDLVQVFALGKYETGEFAAWDAGDWTNDGLFDSGDMVAAFAEGGYEQRTTRLAQGVPEPSFSLIWLLFCFLPIRKLIK